MRNTWATEREVRGITPRLSGDPWCDETVTTLLAGYGRPPAGETALWETIATQQSERVPNDRVQTPSFAVVDEALQRALQQYSAVRPFYRNCRIVPQLDWDDPCVTPVMAEWAIRTFELRKSAGWPFVGKTKEQALQEIGALGFAALCTHRLRALRSSSCDCVCLVRAGAQFTRCTHVRLGLHCDPYTAFCKAEPTKVAKLKGKRWRYIFASSFLDCLCMYFLYKDLMLAEGELVASGNGIPSQVGVDVHSTEHVRDLFNIVQAMRRPGFTVAHSDMKGWDQTVRVWLQVANVDLCWALNGKSAGWYRVAMSQALALSSPFVAFPSGLVIRLEAGVWASGRLDTSFGNSHMRAILSCAQQVLIGAPCDGQSVISYGDDAVELLDIERTPTIYGSWGFDQRDIHEVGEDGSFDFLSHTWHGNPPRVEYLRFPKLLANALINVDGQRWQEQVDNVALKDEDLQTFKRVAQAYGVSLHDGWSMKSFESYGESLRQGAQAL